MLLYLYVILCFVLFVQAGNEKKKKYKDEGVSTFFFSNGIINSVVCIRALILVELLSLLRTFCLFGLQRSGVSVIPSVRICWLSGIFILPPSFFFKSILKLNIDNFFVK